MASSYQPSWREEERLWRAGYARLVGVDEAGRGALAGPVVAAAVVLAFHDDYPYIDSKQLSSKKRQIYAEDIKSQALYWNVSMQSAQAIDEGNIVKATVQASSESLMAAGADAVISDYLELPSSSYVMPLVKADQRSYQVAAASILAKTARDQYMLGLAAIYPEYGFERHKGYATAHHIKQLFAHGPCDAHRKSFEPIKGMLAQTSIFS